MTLFIEYSLFIWATLFLTVQLLHKLSIRSVNGPEKLLKVVKVGDTSFWNESPAILLSPTESNHRSSTHQFSQNQYVNRLTLVSYYTKHYCEQLYLSMLPQSSSPNSYRHCQQHTH